MVQLCQVKKTPTDMEAKIHVAEAVAVMMAEGELGGHR